jgi:hypothetical protein
MLGSWQVTGLKELRHRAYDAENMGQIDEQKERRRLAELYRSLEEGELEEIVRGADSLTPVAKEALRAELSSRGVEAPPMKQEATEALASEAEVPGAPVVIGRYRDSMEAMVAKSMLDSAGIESFLADENLVNLHWLYSNLIGGIKVMVRAEDAETARKLLEEKIPEKFDVDGVGEYIQPRCPKCGSMDVGFDEVDKQSAHVAMALVGVPMVRMHKGGTCHACGHEWDYDGGPSQG